MSTRWLRTLTPATLIVIVTGCFHLYRGAPLDGAVFLAVGAALVADGLLPRSAEVRVDPGVPPWPWCAVVAVAAGVAGGASARYSIADAVLVFVIGLPVVVAVWPRRAAGFTPESGAPMVRAGWAWACVGLAAALWELTTYLLEVSPSGDYRHPSISDLVDPALNPPPARAAFVVCWVALGYCLLRWRRRP
ncbi:hypothetical protein [Spelaeicoccus albus]|uniref:Uncharacterized protein n=1 Tax=Spelaeicoccus albus TaxID=1280376 RepID=A0A7Z0D2K4_9MICO|nr:hypothetical protein [Spelaeicoccus albus]NYI67709.1 hypothetical protein [Spelaeicoccus albus]